MEHPVCKGQDLTVDVYKREKLFTALKGFDRGRAVDIDGDGLPDMTFVPASDGSANFTTTLSLRDKTGTISPFGAGTLTTCVTPDMDPTTYGTDSFRNRGNGTFGGVGTNQCNAGTSFASGAQEATSTQAPAGAALHFDLFNQSIVQFGDLNSIGTSNGLAGTQAKLSSATYSFSGPIYDGRDHVFAGFQTASVTETGDPNSAPSLKRTTTFATQLCSGVSSDSIGCVQPSDRSTTTSLTWSTGAMSV